MRVIKLSEIYNEEVDLYESNEEIAINTIDKEMIEILNWVSVETFTTTIKLQVLAQTSKTLEDIYQKKEYSKTKEIIIKQDSIIKEINEVKKQLEKIKKVDRIRIIDYTLYYLVETFNHNKQEAFIVYCNLDEIEEIKNSMVFNRKDKAINDVIDFLTRNRYDTTRVFNIDYERSKL